MSVVALSGSSPKISMAVSASPTNQIARWLNMAEAQGQLSAIDAIPVAARLAAIERALSETLEQFTAKDGAPC